MDRSTDIKLPYDIMDAIVSLILSNNDIKDIFRLRCVSKQIKYIIDTSFIRWKELIYLDPYNKLFVKKFKKCYYELRTVIGKNYKAILKRYIWINACDSETLFFDRFICRGYDKGCSKYVYPQCYQCNEQQSQMESFDNWTPYRRSKDRQFILRCSKCDVKICHNRIKVMNYLKSSNIYKLKQNAFDLELGGNELFKNNVEWIIIYFKIVYSMNLSTCDVMDIVLGKRSHVSKFNSQLCDFNFYRKMIVHKCFN